MKEHILEVVRQVEREYLVKILYACEAGSRAWGFPSEDSDYDVRFIYVPSMDWYLSIDTNRDVIEIPKQEKVNITVDSRIDMSGWELTKTLRLLRKSNPPLLEWLNSSLVYVQEEIFIDKLRALAYETFSPIPCIHHYLKMAKANFRRLKEAEATSKGYVTVIRPLLAAKWIEKHNRMAPIELYKLIEEMVENDDIRNEFAFILQKKISGEDINSSDFSLLDDYIENELKQIEVYTTTLHQQKTNPTTKLDQFFKETLYTVWG
ncbi:DNA polymerase beta superfamily protein [Fredinandcohnia sp. 179-A 10B2 NHS]|uniref:nucleotidyltransferase domain-containing protein n=1 Tax=Fredinandcohnia sp. 179-A 10B2 NHS TaxID=3235176 RepID=UPI00399EF36B